MSNNNLLQQLVQALINQNPSLSQNQQTMGYLDVIQRGDSAKGEQIADNICKNYGKTREEMIEEAKRFFNIR